MPKTWPLQDATNKLSDVVDRARTSGPQVITRRGEEVPVVLSAADYRRLRRPAQDLLDFLQTPPLAQSGVVLELDRDRSLPRPDVDL